MSKFRLFTRLSLLFFLVLLVVSGINLYISVNAARNHSLEVTQQLDKDLAAATVHMIEPLLDTASTDMVVQDIMHSMMVINPSVEVYLLDDAGAILTYVAPKKVVKLDKVDLAPIKSFITEFSGELILGDDPRNPGEYKIFSAARMIRNGEENGYVYIVLASQEYHSVADTMFGSYILKLTSKSFLVILAIATLFGLLMIWLITGQLRKIIATIGKFKDGDYTSRIPVRRDELSDVSSTFNEMADTIQLQIEELEGVDKLRQELVANISHDLRTPISSIQGFCELLTLREETITKEERQEYLGIINKNVIRLKKLVNDLFELSKLEAGAVSLNFEPLNTAELIHDVSDKYRVLAQEKGISLNTIYAKNLPLAKADIALIDRVLQNLIDNSLKFCNKGDTITIEIDQETPSNLRVQVADSGEGISEKDLPFIFDRYYKGSDNEAKNGTGLGLAISRKIIELHGSVIHVKSKLNVGTKFTFSLPVLT
ncbi:MAG: signal transduction histidine kinase [Flavobacteriales bacterium]|jgi:signal transduction histidine kinase